MFEPRHHSTYDYNSYPLEYTSTGSSHDIFMDNINNQLTHKLGAMNLQLPKLGQSKHLSHQPIDPLETDLDYPDSPQDRRSISSSASSLKSSVSSFTPTSNYWHVLPPPDPLTALAVRDDRLCAIGSSGIVDNLLIYEAFSDSVTHHQSITLPEIHSLKWVDRHSSIGQLGNVLLSGHRNGTVHMTLLPDSQVSTHTPRSAEILKRYNHVKHLPKDQPHRSTRIENLELVNNKWTCCPEQSLFTLCGDHIFLWEPNRSDVPLVVQKTRRTNTFDLCPERDGIYAVGRERGVCIRDIRVRDRVNSGLKPAIGNSENVSLVKWNPFDSGNQFAAVHDRSTIKLWDIRNGQPIGSYKGHADEISSLQWSSNSEFVSSSHDGTVRIWDVFSDSCPTPPTSSEENLLNLNTPNSNYSSTTPSTSSWAQYSNRQALASELDIFGQQLLANPPPVSQKRCFTGMQLADMGPCLEAVTIDNDGFLGIHELQ